MESCIRRRVVLRGKWFAADSQRHSVFLLDTSGVSDSKRIAHTHGTLGSRMGVAGWGRLKEGAKISPTLSLRYAI
jgi:hypothetical protein